MMQERHFKNPYLPNLNTPCKIACVYTHMNIYVLMLQLECFVNFGFSSEFVS